MTMFNIPRVNANPQDIYSVRRIRRGKTARDRENGNAKRNADRKAARAAWQKDNRSTNATFPV